MFSNLRQDSIFYILDKNNEPTLKVGKVTKAVTNPQYYGLANQEIDINVDVNGDNYEFKKIPANLSIVSPSNNVVISDNVEDMTKEFETMLQVSQQVLDSQDYHKKIIESKDRIMSILNPKFAKEKEQENKLIALEGKVGNMEKGIDEIKSMLSDVIKAKKV